MGTPRRRFIYKRQSDPHLAKLHSWFVKAKKGTLTKEEIEVAFQDDPELAALMMKLTRLMKLFEAMDAGEMSSGDCATKVLKDPELLSLMAPVVSDLRKRGLLG